MHSQALKSAEFSQWACDGVNTNSFLENHIQIVPQNFYPLDMTGNHGLPEEENFLMNTLAQALI